MCTTLALRGDAFYFGRNMDLESHFGESVVLMPRRFSLCFQRFGELTKHYAILGMACVREHYPLYADAVNEKGLCMAGLNFPQARYDREMDFRRDNISPFELIPWVLGQCADLDEVRALLAHTHLIAVDFSPQIRLTPLHWHIADRQGSLTLEADGEGMHLYDNPCDVLTNSPSFRFQLFHNARYDALSPHAPRRQAGSDKDATRGAENGSGAIGLPGDYSSPSRFVKAAFLRRWYASDGVDRECLAAACFQILSAVAPPRGVVLSGQGEAHYTVYSTCIDAEHFVYSYRLADRMQVTSVSVTEEERQGDRLVQYALPPQKGVRIPQIEGFSTRT